MVFVLITGNGCIDRIRKVALIPRLGNYVEIEEEIVLIGGEAINTCTALIKWIDEGIKDFELVLACSQIGLDGDGDRLISGLIKKGIPESSLDIPRANIRTPCCDVYVTPDGSRTMFGIGFVNPKPIQYEKHFRKGGWFTCDQNQGDSGKNAVVEAQKHGMNLYLMDYFEQGEDPNPIPKRAVLQYSTDHVGMRGQTEDNIKWANEWLKRHDENFVIVTDGGNGFVCGGHWPTFNDKGENEPVFYPVQHFPVFPIDGIVDSTGAGDVFRAGVLYGLIQGWPPGKSVLWGSIAGGLNCKHFGGSTAITTNHEIEQLIKTHHGIAEVYLSYHP
eukprot:TRINITY_DN1601_c0_g5_i1.p1 TRINITY_DN1601_c0_g5~~TRINITY_DN1601_c0_g5_i1.p1  ORF type:complete len:331 (-),score=66.83 TRINITY_DN1601_c0_g5_i1:98-1090(-)